tara:strand:- start:52 stop:417 length:366 start_codon:yes stop_codon:yes gene_type:complete
LKKIILILAFFVGNNFSQEKFPNKLTCEFLNIIIYFNLGEIKENSWYKVHHSSNILNKNISVKEQWGPEIPLKLGYKIHENQFYIELGSRLNRRYVFINRYSLMATFDGNEGRCYQGKKNY